MNDRQLTELIAAWLDGRITQQESDRLQQELEESSQARATFRKYTQLDASLRELADAANETPRVAPATEPARSSWGAPVWLKLACAAAILIMVGGVAYQVGKETAPATTQISKPFIPETNPEPTLPGYATLRRTAGIRWSNESASYRDGDVLPGGTLAFDEGIAEIDFFSGASLVVEGPAELLLESDWSVELVSGRVRASVPRAARGFIVKAADSEIEDLGTEFAVEVGEDAARVEVLDGEIALHGGGYEDERLLTGDSEMLKGEPENADRINNVSTTLDVGRRKASAQRERFDEWLASSDELRRDDRLIAYYPVAESRDSRDVVNMALATADEDRDGALVGLVNRAPGRLGELSSGLEFSRHGARVRTYIDGEFRQFTFSAWVRIDSLEHVYNALFMGDGYENGEPHWQIRDDGRLMFSVMVDDSFKPTVKGRFDAAPVKDAGRHRVYFTDPIWDIAEKGRWFHLAAVYDPVSRYVRQYVNGVRVSNEKIIDRFHITKLKIGPAEIGNWGQPFRKTPWFAVRNLNGMIDELAIYDAALGDDEIRTLYEQGKPLGH